MEITFKGGTIKLSDGKIIDFKGSYYIVTFKDWDGTVLKTETVSYGSGATAPTSPTRDNHSFNGWDVAYNNITGNLIVTAQYLSIIQNPVILYISRTQTSIKYRITNNNDLAVTLYYERGDSTPDLTMSIPANSYVEIDFTGLAQGTSYTFYFKLYSASYDTSTSATISATQSTSNLTKTWVFYTEIALQNIQIQPYVDLYQSGYYPTKDAALSALQASKPAANYATNSYGYVNWGWSASSHGHFIYKVTEV